jgi:hypothetical protein
VEAHEGPLSPGGDVCPDNESADSCVKSGQPPLYG